MSTESICEKARRLAREDAAVEEAARLAKRQAFLDSMFKPGEYAINEDWTYTICGWRWELWTGAGSTHPYLTFNRSHCGYGDLPAFNKHRGIVLSNHSANDLLSLGKALQEIDKEIAQIDERYPNTLRGRIELWLFTQLT